ncbi:MAG: YfaZ family outer membrane protein [Woeseiaceae bacterium]
MRSRRIRIGLFFSSLALSLTAAAAELDLNVNNDAARLAYAWELPARNLRLDAAWLHHQDRGDVVHLGLHLTGEASSGPNPAMGGVGGRLIAIDASAVDLDGSALAIGGFVRYVLPRYNRVNLYGHAYFAPDVLGFGDADQYKEVEARVGYNILRNADAYIGMRYISAGFDDDLGIDATIDTGFMAGIQLRF